MKKILLPIISIIILGLLFYKGSQMRWAKLFSPGELSLAHAELELSGECDACHTKGKKLDTQKCFECHDDINNLRKSGSGLHGQELEPCLDCHSEHHGRNSDIAYFDMTNFDHRKVGWPLEGMHKKLRCDVCHESDSYLLTKTACIDCHADIHEGENGKDCAECHHQDSFKVE